MATRTNKILAAAVLAFFAAAACTVHKQETPGLTGPSDVATSLAVQVSPDVLTQDGASQSVVTVTARDPNGQPIRNLPLRADITVNGLITDFGTLSARNVVTGTDGRATFIYTAPAAPAVSVDNGILVQISVAPTGTDFANTVPRQATIRLVPPGTVTPPNDLAAVFTVSPGSPTEDNTVLFDAGGSVAANANFTIVSYTWDFGDGGTASGRQVTHKYKAGTYTVLLTIKDATNRTGSNRTTITVTPSADPAPSFIFSPNPPQLNEPIHFDASSSLAAQGHRIVSYTWNFGEGTVRTTASPRIDFTYTLPRTYIVLLTVTDETGKSKTSSGTAITPQ